MADVICPYCGKKAELSTGKRIYPHRLDLHKLLFYVCWKCQAWVGCHKSGRPLGRLADEKLRKAKIAAHDSFDRIWKSGRLTRTEAYKWLAEKLKIPVEECHIGMFDLDTCQRVTIVCGENK
jgi:zinc-finger-containing domain